jgi:hypothetical protein
MAPHWFAGKGREHSRWRQSYNMNLRLRCPKMVQPARSHARCCNAAALGDSHNRLSRNELKPHKVTSTTSLVRTLRGSAI